MTRRNTGTGKANCKLSTQRLTNSSFGQAQSCTRCRRWSSSSTVSRLPVTLPTRTTRCGPPSHSSSSPTQREPSWRVRRRFWPTRAIMPKRDNASASVTDGNDLTPMSNTTLPPVCRKGTQARIFVSVESRHRCSCWQTSFHTNTFPTQPSKGKESGWSQTASSPKSGCKGWSLESVTNDGVPTVEHPAPNRDWTSEVERCGVEVRVSLLLIGESSERPMMSLAGDGCGCDTKLDARLDGPANVWDRLPTEAPRMRPSSARIWDGLRTGLGLARSPRSRLCHWALRWRRRVPRITLAGWPTADVLAEFCKMLPIPSVNGDRSVSESDAVNDDERRVAGDVSEWSAERGPGLMALVIGDAIGETDVNCIELKRMSLSGGSWHKKKEKRVKHLT